MLFLHLVNCACVHLKALEKEAEKLELEIEEAINI